MQKRMLQLRTERLLLKPYEECDRKAMLSLLYNDEIRQTFMLPDFQTEQGAAAMWLRLKAWSLSDRHFEYGIYRQGQLIGFINDVEMDGDRIELGYVIHPDSKNRGYATEALAAAMEELFRMGYAVVQAGLFEGNDASRRVMEKCGMHRIERTETIAYRGENRRCIYYEKRRADAIGARAAQTPARYSDG